MVAPRYLYLIAATTLLGGCATPRTFRNIEKSVYESGEVDVRARLIACDGFNPGTSVSTRESIGVWVDMVVRPDGAVESATVGGNGSANDAALAMARTCVFNPAERNGEAVAVRVRQALRVERTTP